MGIGVLQLSSYSNLDTYLTYKPKVTFFKNRYKRHSIFSSEISKQSFSSRLDFGKESYVDISKNGDLIGKITLIIDLPEILDFKNSSNEIDQIIKFAWVRNIGYRIINNVELIIDNQLIDKQYGEFIKLQNDLSSNKDISRIIGNVDELVKFSSNKNSYQLHIPLPFWFTKKSNSYLPLVSLHNNPINIHVELNSIKKCCIISPSHYIIIDDDIVNFENGEYIIQTINGIEAIGKFEYFDIISRKLYYLKINDVSFSSLIISDPTLIQNESDRDLLLYVQNSDGTFVNSKYLIIGNKTKTYVMPQINSSETIYNSSAVNLDNIKLNDSSLLVEYIYLGKDERDIFKKTQIDCHIEQVLYSGEQFIDGINQNVPIYFTKPCKEIIWISQLVYAQNTIINQWDNYTNSFITDENNNYVGENIITYASITYNGNERVTYRDSKYYDTLLINSQHTYSDNSASPINVFSFCLEPENSAQPTGSVNLTVIENVNLKIRTNTDKISVRTYGIVYNTLRFKNGTAGLLFSGDIVM